MGSDISTAFALQSARAQGELPTDAHRFLATHPDQRVRLAWTRRSDLPGEVVVEALEASLPAAALKRLLSPRAPWAEAVEEEHLEALLSCGVETKVAAALAHPACSDETTRRLVPRAWKERSAVTRALLSLGEGWRSRQGALAEVVMLAPGEHLVALAAHARDLGAQSALVRRLVAPGTPSEVRVSVAEVLERSDPAPGLEEEVLEALGEDEELGLVRDWVDPPRSGPSWRRRSLPTVLHTRDRSRVDTLAEAFLARSAADLDGLYELALLCNPALSPRLRSLLLEEASWSGVQGWLAACEPLGHEEAVAAARAVDRLEGLHARAAGRTALEKVVEQVAGGPGAQHTLLTIGQLVPQHAGVVSAHQRCAAQTVLDLPGPAGVHLTRYHSQGTLLANLLEEVGSEGLEVVLALADDGYPGTLRELTEAARLCLVGR